MQCKSINNVEFDTVLGGCEIDTDSKDLEAINRKQLYAFSVLLISVLAFIV